MKFRFGGVEFGGRAGSLIVEDFQPGEAELRTNDHDRPQRDGVMVGRDYLGGATWAFDLATNTHSMEAARAAAAALAAAWRAQETRLRPNRVSPLSYQMEDGGPWRRVYGRPGNYAGPVGNVHMRLGVGKINADFRVTDPLFYDDALSTVELVAAAEITGGLVAPLVGPLSTMASSGERAGYITNTGDAPTPLKATFYGPITDPWVRSSDGWEIGLEGHIAYDRYVVVDAMVGRAVLDGGAPVHGWLTRKTRLSESKLPVGISDITFGGQDMTGTARVKLQWRPAHMGV